MRRFRGEWDKEGRTEEVEILASLSVFYSLRYTEKKPKSGRCLKYDNEDGPPNIFLSVKKKVGNSKKGRESSVEGGHPGKHDTPDNNPHKPFIG